MSTQKNSLEFEKPLLDLEKQLEDLMTSSQNSDLDFSDEIKAIESKIELTKREVYADLTPWQKVQLSRHPNRPFTKDYIDRVFIMSNFITITKNNQVHWDAIKLALRNFIKKYL